MLYTINKKTFECKATEYYDDIHHIRLKIEYPNSKLCAMLEPISDKALSQKISLQHLYERSKANIAINDQKDLLENLAICIEALDELVKETQDNQYDVVHAKALSNNAVVAMKHTYQLVEQHGFGFNEQFEEDQTYLSVFFVGAIAYFTTLHLFVNHAKGLEQSVHNAFYVGSMLYAMLLPACVSHVKHVYNPHSIVSDAYIAAEEISTLLTGVEALVQVTEL